MTNDQTGRRIGLKEHIAQSIKNILFTRIGSRLMREDYGSLLPELIDMPMTQTVIALCHQAAVTAFQPQRQALLVVIALCHQAAVTAIAAWEPRITVRSIHFNPTAAANGQLAITIVTTLTDGTEQTFQIQ